MEIHVDFGEVAGHWWIIFLREASFSASGCRTFRGSVRLIHGTSGEERAWTIGRTRIRTGFGSDLSAFFLESLLGSESFDPVTSLFPHRLHP